MFPLVFVYLFVLVHFAIGFPADTLSVVNLLSGNGTDPDQELLDDPCAQKSFPDVNQCFHASAPVANSLEDVKYYCCLLWKARDCYETEGKIDCTADELTQLNKVLTDLVVYYDTGKCKQYPYKPGNTTCEPSGY